MINPTGSETSSCLRNVGEIGTTMEMDKRSIKYPGEIWIILHAKTVERKATILITVSAPLRPSLNTMWKHSRI